MSNKSIGIYDYSSINKYMGNSNKNDCEILFSERRSDMTKQIRFMATNTNQSVIYGSDIRLNCFAQYYSEKV